MCILVSVCAVTFAEVQRCGVCGFCCVVCGVGGAVGEGFVLLKQLSIVQIFLMSIYIIGI